MKSCIGLFIGLLLSVSVSAESLVEGRVRLASGEPVADAQIAVFDMTDLRQGAIARAMTDGTGYFALPLAALGGRALPEQFALGPNYPNPFNPSTIIPYQLPTATHVRLEVFNLLGQRIATLVAGERSAGVHTAVWDATDGSGQAVGAGVYLYRLTVGGDSQTGRMVLVDGQAGVAAVGGEGVWSAGIAPDRSYGLVVSGSGIAPYVVADLGIQAGMAPVELVVAAHPAGKALGDDDSPFDLSDLFNTPSAAAPDLVVSSASASDTTLTAGQAFILQAKVRNQGDELSSATVLRYYRSTDATITSGDEEVGTDAIGALNPSATSGVLISLTAPTSAGTYYYGACVESVSGESDTDNNCSEAVTVTVSGTVVAEEDTAAEEEVSEEAQTDSASSPSGPDLVVSSASIDDTTLSEGQAFTLNVTVQNQGDEPAAATVLRYYLSNNATISSSDTEVGTNAIGVLNPRATSGVLISLTAPAGAGTYYYGACVESVSGESDTDNNCSSAVTVTVEQNGDGDDGDGDDGGDEVGQAVGGGTEAEEQAEENVPTRLTRNSAKDESPAWSPDGTQIAFYSDRDGNGEIYVMAADGSQPTRLTRNDALDGSPAWSPDGTQIAFDSTRDGTWNWNIYVMAADGSQPTRLTRNSAHDRSPAWSPDGTQIAFESYRDGNREIYVMAADGSQPTRLTRNDGWDGQPSWSPDGTQIAFESDRDGNNEIYVMAADGSQPTNLTRNDARDGSPAWSPDGTQIAFYSDRDGNGEIYVMAADGSQPTRLTRNDALDGSPAWSPDGTQIAFASKRDGNWEIYVMAAKPETSSDGGGDGGGSSDDHSNTRSGATDLPLGSSRSGEIETGSDVDYFRVQVGESGTLTVYTTGNLDTKGELQSSSGSRLASNDDGGSGSNFRIERSVSAGTYYVKVEGFSSSSTGSYTIHASFQSTSEGGNGGDNGDLSASNVNCSGSYLFGNSGSATITITGTVYAHRGMSSLTLIGYANGKWVGIDYIGSLGAGESENFIISGIISTSGSSLNCSVEWEATVFNSAKVTAGDAESSQQVRVQGSLSPSSALINRKRSLEQP